MQKTYLINCNGEIYKMTKENYIKFLKDGIRGVGGNLNNYGEFIGNIEINATNLYPKEYKAFLEYIEKEEQL
jgi:hypothetical protein